MPAFSITDAAFAGFRLIREKPKTILSWTVIYLGLQIAILLLSTLAFPEAFRKLQVMQGEGAAASPEEAVAALKDLAPFLLAAIPLSIAFYAIAYSAIYRAFLRPDDHHFGAVRFSRDELNMAGLLVAMFVLGMGYLFILAFAFGLIVTAGAHAGGSVQTFVDIIAGLVLIAAIVYPAVRLSLVYPATLDQGHIRIFSTWRLTRGMFWKVLAAYLLCTLMLIVAYLLAMIVFMAIAGAIMIATGGDFAAMKQAMTPATIAGYLSPFAIASLIFSSLLASCMYAVLFGPSAEAYRELALGSNAPAGPFADAP